jgi:hypothetical protein
MRALQTIKNSSRKPSTFISYAHFDKKHIEELNNHFGFLSRLNTIAIWYEHEHKPDNHV